MFIKTISLANFRNHTSYHLDFNPTTTLIIGANGCGKTSVLEAIYILTRGKSFRSTDPDIIKHGTPFYRIELEYSNGTKVAATYDGKTKTFLTLDQKTRRLPKKSRYPVVLFEPPDLNLINGSPSRRRDFFNRYFSGISEEYASSISRYDKAMRQRNELLKSDSCSVATLFSWNLLLAKYGTIISHLRTKYTAEINHDLTLVYRSIAENDDQINLNLVTEVNNITESAYLKILEQNQSKDHLLGHTTFGIHKDDFEFIFNHKKASGSASRGETRSIILALKFIEADTLEQTTGQKPIILLDDVFSELDGKRKKALVNNFKSHQVIITSVEK
ncbi:DNA replication and repair protein RecF [Candidatus Saccharibacteria bacterium]|nr:DNA replication and repair protein RecF [Candidatus Saccharibacteria bacterium]